jgi:hypothetical protein
LKVQREAASKLVQWPIGNICCWTRGLVGSEELSEAELLEFVS